jgi:hypothetical protein
MLVVADLEFELRNASLQIEEVLLQVGLLAFESRNLLLKLGILSLLPMVALLHLVFGPIMQSF